MTLTDESDREIVISRLIEGPRPIVFRAYSDVEHLSQWWGPDGFTTSTHSFDFRVGGAWDFIMHGPDGTDFPNFVEWLEITPPERLVIRHGERPDDPDAFTQSIAFEEAPGGTLVTMRAVFPTKERLDLVVREFGAIEGGHQHLARFNDYIRSIATGTASGR
ncbi:MAG: SRPBCC family protein [Dehalococcoidia bacterium]|nr:SRPBCC family protein [Dehalococcoidia bacterium]